MAAIQGFTHTIDSASHFVATALPRGWKRDGSRPAVLIMPGTDESFSFPYLPTKGVALVDQVVQAGYPCALFQPTTTPTGIGDLWANDKLLQLHRRYAHLHARRGSRREGGQSRTPRCLPGALNALAYAGRYPANVAGVQAYLPNTSLAATKANSGYTAAVNAAYGGTTLTPPTAHSTHPKS